ncbi:MAG: dihydroorotase [Duncaniella sp.]|nr:dihydroorotase [Muribaculum sp.]MCM1255266.1 dihydroorotase [Duncaniella sp.]
MARILIYNAYIVNEGDSYYGYILTDGQFIAKVGAMDSLKEGELEEITKWSTKAIDAKGSIVMPGVIDTHVHFREPGMTEKADIASESKAALAGGVTSFVEMPNTKPATVTMAAVEDKLRRAARSSRVNYGFFLGATNDNLEEIANADYSRVAGVKLFLGSSTGNMLVDKQKALDDLFATAPAVIAVHAEDESIVNEARERLSKEYNSDIPVECHPDMRPREACIAATDHALELAKRHNARLHVCHISTAEELQHIRQAKADGVKVTAETCPQYLLFDRNDFYRYGARIKCNPSIKEPSDRIALQLQLHKGVIDSIATDHAPHLLSQKEGNALTAASGMPMVQYSLPVMLAMMSMESGFESVTLADIAELMCHAPAKIFGIDRRGFIRPGYYADLVIIGPNQDKTHRPIKIKSEDVISRCGWSPLEGVALPYKVSAVMINGDIAYSNSHFLTATPLPLKFNSNNQSR